MIENTKCECGHNNPVETILCEYCGKLLDEGTSPDASIEKEMRYEGKARRSLRKPLCWHDYIWNFFSSVKIAIMLILLTLIAAVIGSLLPQEQFIPSLTPADYYHEHYGLWGDLFYHLGFTKMYDAWWFILLLGSIGISLVICSLDRVLPLYKALKNQTVVKNIQFIRRQKIAHTISVPLDQKEAMVQQLNRRGFRVSQEGDFLLAEKGRWSRWGPYINHIGLIVVLLALLLRYLPGWYLDNSLWIREGETKPVPGTTYWLKNERAFAEWYPPSSNNTNSIVKNYQTNVTLYTNEMKPIIKQAIQVNHPLDYKGLLLYQSDLRMDEISGLSFRVIEKKTQKTMGKFRVDFHELSDQKKWKVNADLEVKVVEYYPDFAMENKKPITRSNEPNRPAFIFEISHMHHPEKERLWAISGQNVDQMFPKNKYVVRLLDIHTANSSRLMVRMDRFLPIVFVGGFISMIGLILGFYWQHRRIWAAFQDGQVHIGAHTNKNWYSLSQEVDQIIQRVKSG